MSEALMDLKRALEKEVAEIVKKNDISPTELERLDIAIDIIKDIETIDAMKNYENPEVERGYSERYPYSERNYRMNNYP